MTADIEEKATKKRHPGLKLCAAAGEPPATAPSSLFSLAFGEETLEERPLVVEILSDGWSTAAWDAGSLLLISEDIACKATLHWTIAGAVKDTE